MDSINYSQGLISSSQIMQENGSFGELLIKNKTKMGLSCIEVWFFRWTMWSSRLVSVSFTCQFTNEARFFKLIEFQSWIFKGKIYVSWDIYIYLLSKCNFILKKILLCVCLKCTISHLHCNSVWFVSINWMNHLF